MGKLNGKVAVVTGGGQGLGFAMARAFAEEGANVVITGRVQEKLDAKAKDLRDLGVEALPIAGDVQFRSTAKDVVARTLETFGRLDILVNNAQAIYRGVPLEDQPDEQLENAIRSGLFGTIYFMQEAYPALKKQGGHIINIGSEGGVLGNLGRASYAAAKEGIRGVSRVAAREWGKDKIFVNVICPGAKSENFMEYFKTRPDELAQYESKLSLRRFASAEDMGRLALYLASPECFITGQTLFLDGGQVLH